MLTSCPEKECVCVGCVVVMALERVGHRLSDAMPGLEATQKTSPVIGHSAADNPDQFRIHW
ncbi:hypothetical protein [Bilophila wadsworthia]|uniref:hypothetical protein n=1 Tax=Bilophila wadsworthia TaxID=35833 RepID=UPI00351FDDE4